MMWWYETLQALDIDPEADVETLRNAAEVRGCIVAGPIAMVSKPDEGEEVEKVHLAKVSNPSGIVFEGITGTSSQEALGMALAAALQAITEENQDYPFERGRH